MYGRNLGSLYITMQNTILPIITIKCATLYPSVNRIVNEFMICKITRTKKYLLN